MAEVGAGSGGDAGGGGGDDVDHLEWARDVLDRELRALVRTVTFHEDNNNAVKGFLLLLLVVWGTITIGIAFGVAESTPIHTMLTALVWALVGRVWGGEAKDVTGGAGGG